jgi:hypothetical protein
MTDPERTDRASDDPGAVQDEDEEDLPWPVGFIVFVSAAALYLLWRLIQVAAWVVHRLT